MYFHLNTSLPQARYKSKYQMEIFFMELSLIWRRQWHPILSPSFWLQAAGAQQLPKAGPVVPSPTPLPPLPEAAACTRGDNTDLIRGLLPPPHPLLAASSGSDTTLVAARAPPLRLPRLAEEAASVQHPCGLRPKATAVPRAHGGTQLQLDLN